jgi:hypothetical protein
MVPLRGGQWAEVKTLVVGRVEQVPTATGSARPRAVALSYFSRKADAETFTRAATSETHRRGTETAQRVCAPADGAVWVQHFLDVQRPDAVRILDFPHAVEHLSTAAAATFGAGSAAAQAWLCPVRRELRDGEPAAALAALGSLPVEQAVDVVAAAATRDAALEYFASRYTQIDYAALRAAGYPLGSGAVESANKLVVEARLKGSGMHWAAANVNPMLALRTAWCSDRWSERWQERQRQAQQARTERRRPRRAAAAPRTAPPPTPVEGAPAPDPRPPAVPPVGLRRSIPAHPWRRYGRSLTPRPSATL